MRALLLALLLSGCGPMLKGPVLPALPTPALRPGHGLPTYDPEPRGPVLPRSPHARVLPETPETRKGPGVWAGDPPRASASPGDMPWVFGIPLPPPTGDGKYEHACFASMAMAGVSFAQIMDVLYALPPETKRCVVYRAFASCLSTMARRQMEKMKTRQTPGGMIAATDMSKAADGAVAAAQEACRGIKGTDDPYTALVRGMRDPFEYLITKGVLQ